MTAWRHLWLIFAKGTGKHRYAQTWGDTGLDILHPQDGPHP